MKLSESRFRRRLDDHSGSVDRMSLDERGLNQLKLNHAVEAFLRKWPDVENATNSVLALHQMRTGLLYKGLRALGMRSRSRRGWQWLRVLTCLGGKGFRGRHGFDGETESRPACGVVARFEN